MATAVHSYAREASRVHDIAGLTDADIARATGAAPSTARAWLAGTRNPTGERADRLIELSALVERLQRVMENSYIPVWLRRPIEALDDRIACLFDVLTFKIEERKLGPSGPRGGGTVN